MSSKRPRNHLRPGAQTFVGCLRKFLTPAFYKQVHRAAPRQRSRRWELQPALRTLLTMTGYLGDSQQSLQAV